jgi:hypothetical protein
MIEPRRLPAAGPVSHPFRLRPARGLCVACVVCGRPPSRPFPKQRGGKTSGCRTTCCSAQDDSGILGSVREPEPRAVWRGTGCVDQAKHVQAVPACAVQTRDMKGFQTETGAPRREVRAMAGGRRVPDPQRAAPRRDQGSGQPDIRRRVPGRGLVLPHLREPSESLVE